MARGRLKLKRQDLQAALDGDLTARHKFVLKHNHFVMARTSKQSVIV